MSEFRVVRFTTNEVHAVFTEHSEAVAVARDLAQQHREPFAVRGVLQYDNELLACINHRWRAKP